MKQIIIILFLMIPLWAESLLHDESWADQYIYGADVYDTLAVRFDKNWFTRLLYESVIRTNSQTTVKADPNGKRESPYAKFDGKIIDTVIIHTIKPFRDNEIAADSSKGERIREQLTLQTNERIIRNILGIEAGDTVQHYKIEEAERYLRSQPYISDLSIVVKTIDSRRVAVRVVKKEAFPYSFSFAVYDLHSFKVGLNNRNFGRIGGDFRNTLFFDNRYSQRFGYQGDLAFNNIGKTYHYIRFTGENRALYDRVKLSFGRDFVMRDITDAWGIDIIAKSEQVDLVDTAGFNIKSHTEDLWYGHAVNFKNSHSQSLFLTGRYRRDRFVHRPLVGFTTNEQYHNEDLVLGAVILRDLNFFKSRLIYSFGVTEDVPYGLMLQCTGGYRFSEFLERPYVDVRFSAGQYISNLGYFAGGFSVSSYFRDGTVEDGVLKLRLFYYSPLVSMGNSRLRILTNADYVQGRNLLRYSELSLNKRVRYISDFDVTGDVRASLKIEPVLFLPWNLAGFRFAPFLFSDMAMITESPALVDDSGGVIGLGGGVRIRNESLVFNTLEIAGGYYPPIGERDSRWEFSFASSIKPTFRGFSVGRPSQLAFE